MSRRNGLQRGVGYLLRALRDAELDAGFDLTAPRVRRTYAGYYQCAAGAWSWCLLDTYGKEVAGSQYPLWLVVRHKFLPSAGMYGVDFDPPAGWQDPRYVARPSAGGTP